MNHVFVLYSNPELVSDKWQLVQFFKLLDCSRRRIVIIIWGRSMRNLGSLRSFVEASLLLGLWIDIIFLIHFIILILGIRVNNLFSLARFLILTLGSSCRPTRLRILTIYGFLISIQFWILWGRICSIRNNLFHLNILCFLDWLRLLIIFTAWFIIFTNVKTTPISILTLISILLLFVFFQFLLWLFCLCLPSYIINCNFTSIPRKQGCFIFFM